MSIATVINYCTNDYRFLKFCVSEAKKFSHQILIPVADHFFNGTPENRQLLSQSYREHPDCTFIEYHFDPKKPYGIYCPYSPEDPEWIKYWHSTSRYLGFLRTETEYVNFIDVDEVIDGDRFASFLKTFPYRDYNAMRFYSYFYFREPIYRATTYSTNMLLVRSEAVSSPEMILTPHERKGLFDTILGAKIEPLLGLDDEPLVHHFSWVRSPEELYFKVSSWGHSLERDWTTLLKEELSHPFNYTEKLYNLNYEKVFSRFDVL